MLFDWKIIIISYFNLSLELEGGYEYIYICLGIGLFREVFLGGICFKIYGCSFFLILGKVLIFL